MCDEKFSKDVRITFILGVGNDYEGDDDFEYAGVLCTPEELGIDLDNVIVKDGDRPATDYVICIDGDDDLNNIVRISIDDMLIYCEMTYARFKTLPVELRKRIVLENAEKYIPDKLEGTEDDGHYDFAAFRKRLDELKREYKDED